MSVASIMASLGLNTSPFTSGLRTAEQQAASSHASMAASASRNTAAHDNFLASNRKVANQIHNFSRDLASGADASQLFASGIEGIGKSLKLSLGALASIGVGAVAVAEVAKIIQEIKALEKEIKDLTSPTAPAEFRALSSIEEHATKVIAALKKVEDQQNRIEQSRVVYGAPETGDPDSAAIEKNRENNIGRLKRAGDHDLEDATKKKSSQLDISGSNEADYLKKARISTAAAQEKIGETGMPGSSKENQNLSIELRRELEQTLLGIAESVASKRRERLQLTLGERAGGPGYGDQNNNSLQAIYESSQAREVQRLEAESKDRVNRFGDLNGAQVLQNRADDIRNGLNTVKDSEKDLKGEFKGALDASTILQSIRDNTAKPLTNQ